MLNLTTNHYASVGRKLASVGRKDASLGRKDASVGRLWEAKTVGMSCFARCAKQINMFNKKHVVTAYRFEADMLQPTITHCYRNATSSYEKKSGPRRKTFFFSGFLHSEMNA